MPCRLCGVFVWKDVAWKRDGPATSSLAERSRLFLLRRNDCVFGGFGDAELDDLLRRDLDRFAGSRIPAHARFPVDPHQSADARQHEDPILLHFGDRETGEVLEHRARLLVRDLALFREPTDQLGLGHSLSCSHQTSLYELLRTQHMRRNPVFTGLIYTCLFLSRYNHTERAWRSKVEISPKHGVFTGFFTR